MPYIDATVEQIQQHASRYTVQKLSSIQTFMTDVEDRQDAQGNRKSSASSAPKQVPDLNPSYPKTSTRARSSICSPS
jgi:hypothetical protein